MERATLNRKEHFRLYKAGKQWVFAGIFALSATIGMSQLNQVSADTQAPDATTQSGEQASTASPTAKLTTSQTADSTAQATSDPATQAPTTDQPAAPATAEATDPSAAEATTPTVEYKSGDADYGQSQRDLSNAAADATAAGLDVTKDANATEDATAGADYEQKAADVATKAEATAQALKTATAAQQANNKAYDDALKAREDSINQATTASFTGKDQSEVKKFFGSDLDTMTAIRAIDSPTALNDAAKATDAGENAQDGAKWVYKGQLVDAKTGRAIDVIETITNIKPYAGQTETVLKHNDVGFSIDMTSKNIESYTVNFQYLYSDTQEPASINSYIDFTDLDENQITSFDKGDVTRSLYGDDITETDADGKQVYTSSMPNDSGEMGIDELWVAQMNSTGTTFTVTYPVYAKGPGGWTDFTYNGFALKNVPEKTLVDKTTYPATYQLTDFNVTSTYTVNYVGGPSDGTKSTQTVVWTSTTDKDGNVTYTPDKTNIAVPTPTVAGYSADTPVAYSTALTATTTAPSNPEVTVTYTATAVPADMTVTIYDDTTGKAVGSTTVNGNVGENLAKAITAKGLTGYKLSTTQPDATKFTASIAGDVLTINSPETFAADDSDNFVVHVAHIIDHITPPTETGDKNYDATHKTYTVTVTGVAPAGVTSDLTPTNGNQSFVLTRSIDIDEVSGKVTASAWQPAKNAAQTITAVPLTDYTASPASITADTITNKLTAFAATNTDDDGSYTDTITYTEAATDQTVNIHYVYQNVNGPELSKTVTLTGKAGTTYSFKTPATIEGPNDDKGAALPDGDGKLDTSTLYYYATSDLNGGQYNTLADDGATDGQFGTNGQDVWVMYVPAEKKLGVITSEPNADGNIVVTLTDGSTFTVPKGTDGKDGKDGVDGQTPQVKLVTNTDGSKSYIFYTTDKDGNETTISTVPAPVDGKDGKDGTDGKDGVDGQTPQVKLVTNTDGSKSYIFYTTDKDGHETTISTVPAPVDGKDGKDGVDGTNGQTPKVKLVTNTDGSKSYIFYTTDKTGHETTISTVPAPADGKNGKDGADGQTPQVKLVTNTDGSKSYIFYTTDKDGHETTISTVPAPADGKNGKDGADGKDGKDGSFDVDWGGTPIMTTTGHHIPNTEGGITTSKTTTRSYNGGSGVSTSLTGGDGTTLGASSTLVAYAGDASSASGVTTLPATGTGSAGNLPQAGDAGTDLGIALVGAGLTAMAAISAYGATRKRREMHSDLY
ncbi:hypothetical protein FD02_GL001711 [Lacticaseibacillus nasuensis JCM 17158]|uniref:Gram-positive cocci surface proteins LPxTG domain-containing protein n=2 Tax=Lacticaseibacillus TaxID=2759736 RepID=A0A0R1JYR7_9LACO|nr:hypothetical protein FD02_GL001711 [Lacticaseibacillus nasuensis JCM 17158]